MPAVSVYDPLTVTMCRTIDSAGQSKSPDDMNIGLASSASRILCTELDYEETENYRQSTQDRLKSKYLVLSSPSPDNNNDKTESAGSSGTSNVGSLKSSCSKEPRLPEPKVVLYEPDKVNLGWSKNFPVGAGMYNVGNTCYLNSTLQALFHVPALVNWLLTDTHHESKCNDGNDGASECLTCAVAKTLNCSHQKSGEAIRPFLVYNKLKQICRTMVPGQQEDAHEFLRYLLEGMEKAYLTRREATKLDSYSKETTPINQIFGGYIRTEVKCLQCKHISTTFQHFQDLLLDIRKANTLDEALAGYFSQEMLDSNDYKCEACKRRVPACKQFILERPPKVLCVQLKRFSVMGGKISRHVSFKQTVDMSPYMRHKSSESANKVVYRLTSMVTHMGPSVNCGHYTAVAQVSSGKFFSFDDSSVRPISLNSVTSTNAYIMIFEMEPSSVTNGHNTLNNQLNSSKGEISLSKSPSSSLSSYSHSNGMSNKLDGSSRAMTPSRNGEGPSSSTLSISTRLPLGSRSVSSYTSSYGSRPFVRDSSLVRTPPTPPPPSITRYSSPLSSSLSRTYISPRSSTLSTYEKNRQNETSKSGKLVDYDGDTSEDEDKSSQGVFKKDQSLNNNNKSLDRNSSPPKSNKSNGNNTHTNSPRRARSRSPTTNNHHHHHHHNGNNNDSESMTTNGNGNHRSNSNSRSGSNGSTSRGSSPKNGIGNGKADHHNGSSSSFDKSKWNSSKSLNNSPDRKIYTKASASFNKGWHVSKESSPTLPISTSNGWLVSDILSDESNSNSSKSNSQSMTSYNADSRSYNNGNNRSDGVSHLNKTSLFGYGNVGVQSWNGGKAQLDREIENERRQEIVKRRYDDEDDEIDRGRTKKIKFHHEHKNRGNDSNHNHFQEYHNKNKWKNLDNNHYRHNSQPYRSRHRGGGGGNYNYKKQNHRYNNHHKNRNHWRR